MKKGKEHNDIYEKNGRKIKPLVSLRLIWHKTTNGGQEKGIESLALYDHHYQTFGRKNLTP